MSRSIKIFICECVCNNDDVSILAALTNLQFDQYVWIRFRVFGPANRIPRVHQGGIDSSRCGGPWELFGALSVTNKPIPSRGGVRVGGCAGPGLGPLAPGPGLGSRPRAHGPRADRPGARIGLSFPQIRGDAALKSWNVNGGQVKDLLGVFLRSRQRVIRQLGAWGCGDL